MVVTSIGQDGKLVDSYETPFGIRTIEFTADNGFLLNGKRVPLNGVCDHHDLGALGAAINDARAGTADSDSEGDGLQRHSHQP